MGGLVALICFCCVSGIVNIAGTYSELKIPGSRNESIRSQDKPNQKSSGKLIWPDISFLQSGCSSVSHLPVYGVQVEDYLAYKWSLRMLFVPKLKIIVNGKIFNEYSGSDVDLEAIVDFIWLNMRLLPRVPLRVLPVDYTNSPQFFNEPNHICLYASWLITILGFGYIFIVLISRYHWFTSLINGICGLSLGSVRSHGRNQ
ncbi:unnamed protein product [Heterobilharzia americana]|nr:unnamed protein product [Heterobilharzia americana]